MAEEFTTWAFLQAFFLMWTTLGSPFQHTELYFISQLPWTSGICAEESTSGNLCPWHTARKHPGKTQVSYPMHWSKATGLVEKHPSLPSEASLCLWQGPALKRRHPKHLCPSRWLQWQLWSTLLYFQALRLSHVPFTSGHLAWALLLVEELSSLLTCCPFPAK